MLKQKLKLIKKIIIVMYELFVSFLSPLFILFISTWLSDTPKGYGYSVPVGELSFYKILGTITLIIYIIILIPIILLFKKISFSKKNFFFHLFIILIGISIGVIHFFI